MCEKIKGLLATRGLLITSVKCMGKNRRNWGILVGGRYRIKVENGGLQKRVSYGRYKVVKLNDVFQDEQKGLM